MLIERRNLTALGRKRRREFDRSIQRLRDLGMPGWAVEYYRRTARIAGLPPHMVVCHLAVVAAGRQMQINRPHAQIAEGTLGATIPPNGQDGAPPAPPSYESVQALRRCITGLWHEIQRHSALPETVDGERAAGPGRSAGEAAPAAVTPLRARVSARERTGTRSRRR